MQLHLETDIAAPADSVWRVLGTQFADIDEWAAFVQTSRPIGLDEVPASIVASPEAPVPGRETTTKVTLKEILTAYSDSDRSLTFLGDGLPPIVKRAQNVQSVRAIGPEASTVSFDVTFDFVGPFAVLSPVMKKRMSKTFAGIQSDLKRHVESQN